MFFLDILIPTILVIYGAINIFAIIAVATILPELLAETENSIERSLPAVYTDIWDSLRDKLNVAGSIIIEILIHILMLPTIIILSLVIYVIIIPCKHACILFYYIFRNRDKINVPDDDLDIKSDIDF